MQQMADIPPAGSLSQQFSSKNSLPIVHSKNSFTTEGVHNSCEKRRRTWLYKVTLDLAINNISSMRKTVSQIQFTRTSKNSLTAFCTWELRVETVESDYKTLSADDENLGETMKELPCGHLNRNIYNSCGTSSGRQPGALQQQSTTSQ